MTIEFKRAMNGSLPPGHWKHAQTTDMQVQVGCPGCQRALALPAHQIAADGTVTPAVECPECEFANLIKLRGYDGHPPSSVLQSPRTH